MKGRRPIRILNLIYLQFIWQLSCQWSDLWFEDGSNSAGPWNATNGVVYDYDVVPNNCVTGTCIDMSYGQSMFRQSDITSYSRLRLKFDLTVVDPHGATYGYGACRIHYAYDSFAEKTLVESIQLCATCTPYYDNQTVVFSFPVAKSTLWIWFETQSGTIGMNNCYWDNIHLQGILGTQMTYAPTLAPNNHTTLPPEWMDIWFEDGTLSDQTGWEISGSYFEYDYYNTDACFTGNCIQLTSAGVSTSLIRSTTIGIYSQLRLRLDMSMNKITMGIDGPGTCNLHYAYQSKPFKTELQSFAYPDRTSGIVKYDDLYVSLPSASGKTSVYVWFEASSVGGYVFQYCYFDNIYLQGVIDPNIPDPTTAPTMEPTSYPTRVPSESPTDNPSQLPTQSTSYPTRVPSESPTDNPSQSPSQITSNPSYSPTKSTTTASPHSLNPSKAPTTASPHSLDPSKAPNTPSYPPYYTHTMGETIVDQTSDMGPAKAEGQEANTNFGLITFLIALFLLIFIVVALADGRKFRPNDYFNAGSLMTAALQMIDCASDIFFAVRITKHPEFESDSPLLILFILSLIFILMPVVVSVVQLYSIISNHWNKNDRMRAWLRDGIYQLLMLSFVCGSSFAAVQICSSNAFDLNLFSIPLSKLDKAGFQCKRVYSVVLFENVPQLIIAITFIAIVGVEDENNAIVYVSMVFSAISIFMMVMSSLTTKELLDTQDYSVILLNVTGSMFGDNLKHCRTKTNAIRRHMSVLLGVDESLVEIPRPRQIHHGFLLEFILIINHSTVSELGIKDKILDSDTNTIIADFICQCWELSASPSVEVKQFKQNAPKQDALQMASKNSDEAANLSTGEIKRPVSVQKKEDSESSVDESAEQDVDQAADATNP